MTSSVKGKTTEEAEALFRAFHDMLTGGPDAPGDTTALGKLAALAGVKRFPVRVKCANLPWHTLHAALTGSEEPASTE
jgi:nitrogen fixation NifU-like protein